MMLVSCMVRTIRFPLDGNCRRQAPTSGLWLVRWERWTIRIPGGGGLPAPGDAFSDTATPTYSSPPPSRWATVMAGVIGPAVVCSWYWEACGKGGALVGAAMSASSRVAPEPAVNRLAWVASPEAPDASPKYDQIRFPPLASLFPGVKVPAEIAGCLPEFLDVPLTGAAVATPWNSEIVYWKMLLSIGVLNETVTVVIPGRALARTKIAEARSPPGLVPETAGEAGHG